MPMDWRDPDGDGVVGAGVHSGECVGRRRLSPAEAIGTPTAFRDVLLEMARSSSWVAE
jgi:hypothetical protein